MPCALRRLLVLALHLWVVGVAVHASGLFGDAADLVLVLVTGEDAPCDDCCQDDRGCDCPMGCANCHTLRHAGSLPQASVTAGLLPVGGSREVSVPPYEAAPPTLPELRSLYRPPRG